MLEIRLIAVFVMCTAFLAVSGFIIVKSAGKAENKPRIFIMLPVSENTADIEFLVRTCVYKAAEQYPEAVVLLCDYGAEEDTVYIFERLMRNSCKYYVINPNNCEENICKIINSVV